jgi:hypothetical protein
MQGERLRERKEGKIQKGRRQREKQKTKHRAGPTKGKK